MAQQLNAGTRPRPAMTKFLVWLPIVALAIFILTPLLSSLTYSFFRSDGSFTTSGLTGLADSGKIVAPLTRSLIVSVLAAAVLIATVVPAVVAVHLWAPKMRSVLSILCTLPLVVPAIAIVAGLSAVLRNLASHGRGSLGMELNTILQSQDLPLVLVGTYVVLCLPFTFRSIDAGLSTLPLRTLYESSSILGARMGTTLWQVVMPNIRGPIIFSAFFTFALSIAEYTVAATLSINTLPVFLNTLSSTNFRGSITLSVLLNLTTWLLLASATLSASRFGHRSQAEPAPTAANEPRKEAEIS
ncbi:ABC transporter permease [Brevibacterium antiquum]|uniref:Putative spermidine/putrescine transport system permease protein n=2 Tax=Brevibacterium antiquum TaxID=234835 RepID=A0A2H1IUW9_9MICO|nr:ABC transporter permease subunit [Brevibacterium antiquum]SMX75007.1 putative spermidine/putrescine transport system permease protein [Brevibacterium antiquum]SMX79009.1 putative spermidine/putrescine transport system permease protein [Brevibacterium antiquum CNRZ 918]